jgi:hypothetical protein
VALQLATSWGYDARLAMACGFVGTGLILIIARLLPETKGTDLKSD